MQPTNARNRWPLYQRKFSRQMGHFRLAQARADELHCLAPKYPASSAGVLSIVSKVLRISLLHEAQEPTLILAFDEDRQESSDSLAT